VAIGVSGSQNREQKIGVPRDRRRGNVNVAAENGGGGQPQYRAVADGRSAGNLGRDRAIQQVRVSRCRRAVRSAA
jgi:hypothetical protein